VAARSKTWGLWPLTSWDCRFESRRATDVGLLWVLFVVRYRSIRRVDRWFRGVPLSVFCVCVCVCDRDYSIVRKPWPIRGCYAVRKIIKISDTFDYPTFIRPRLVKIIGIHVQTKRNKWLVNSYDAQRKRWIKNSSQSKNDLSQTFRNLIAENFISQIFILNHHATVAVQNKCL